MKFLIQHRYTGDTICEVELDASYENKPRSVQLGAAVKIAAGHKINLAYADLTYADLVGADLANANLAQANLTYANLADANLTYADLVGADLANANLAQANLTYANLADADLAGQGILQINGLRWPIIVTPGNMTIGCEQHSHDDWRSFDDRRILQMDGRDSLNFWSENKDWLLACCAWAQDFRKKGDAA